MVCDNLLTNTFDSDNDENIFAESIVTSTPHSAVLSNNRVIEREMVKEVKCTAHRVGKNVERIKGIDGIL